MIIPPIEPWYDNVTVKKTGTGTETIYRFQLEEKNFLRITHVTVVDETSAVDGISFGRHIQGTTHYLKKNEPAGANESVDWDGELWLRPRDTLVIEVTGGAANDVLQVYAFGEFYVEE